MPNYVQNILRLEGEEKRIKEFLQFVKGEKSAFDFNCLIPMPGDLAIECSSRQNISFAVYLYQQTGEIQEFLQLRHNNYCKQVKKVSLSKYVDFLLQSGAAELSLGEKAYNNLKTYGHKDWYSWCVANWNTKWNAMDVEFYEYVNKIRFQTAWSAPVPVIEKLSALFPDITIHYLWSDEDMGANCGEMFYYANDGKAETFVENFSSEAYSIFVECWGESDCLAQDKKGNYYKKHCDECDKCA